MSVELLAPAKDLDTGIAAINCGADAVYIGATRFGAREAAGNSLGELDALIQYAHKYWAKVYVTVNTLLYDSEIADAVLLIKQLYQCGADAVIIQDLGLLECDLPPIPIFASTQMHNHTPERVAFLEKVGIKRVILARELSLEQIQEIRRKTSIELETFIHGALCVSYSGQCTLSYAIGGRSGNRGQCAQPCRNLYSLLDGNGETIIRNRHLLSIRDLNLTDHLKGLLDAGVSSFKIEGRLKDKTYVMNTVSHYRQVIDRLEVKRSSSGKTTLDFEPVVAKTFNRGYSDYFILGRSGKIGSHDTPKTIGELIGKVKEVARGGFCLDENREPVLLHNGDGLSFFTAGKELTGTLVNRVDGKWIFPARLDDISPGLALYRNSDKAFLDQLKRSQPVRKIGVTMTLTQTVNGYQLELQDEDGVVGKSELVCEHQSAEKPDKAIENIHKQLTKLGETDFVCTDLKVVITPTPFLAASWLNDLRRTAVEALTNAREFQRPEVSGEIIPNDTQYPVKELTYLGNVLNEKAAAFYNRHGVTSIEPAAESGMDLRGRKVMTTKYCLRYELDACLKEKNAKVLQEPLTLVDENGRKLRLKFDCVACEMHVFFERSSNNVLTFPYG
ncbi:MAG: collagenase-like protease [Chloroflexi bacterium HGW-Chloroflexi-4]|jgi:putative protease|nr:MAG: collagenase-like protease [Chloroflexi bacterium HGW-Chloroflexi-4]